MPYVGEMAEIILIGARKALPHQPQTVGRTSPGWTLGGKVWACVPVNLFKFMDSFVHLDQVPSFSSLLQTC